MIVTTTNAATDNKKLEEFREQAKALCAPRYEEFHRNVEAYGFSKITLPQKTRRRA